MILPVVPGSILPLTLPTTKKDQPGEAENIRQRRVNQMSQKITHFSPFSLSSKRNNRHFVCPFKTETETDALASLRHHQSQTRVCPDISLPLAAVLPLRAT